MKRLPILFALLIACIAVHAQTLQFGPRAGLNFSNVTANGASEDGRTRLHLGVFAIHGISDQVAAQVEILYSQQGATQVGSSLTGPITMNYLNIPLLVRYQVIPGLATYAGPQVGFLLKGEFESESSGNVFDVTHTLAGTEVALLLGAEYEVYEGLHAGMRYVFSLSDIHSDEDKNGKNLVLQISLAYDIASLFVK